MVRPSDVKCFTMNHSLVLFHQRTLDSSARKPRFPRGKKKAHSYRSIPFPSGLAIASLRLFGRSLVQIELAFRT
jgi:hypothetical protein